MTSNDNEPTVDAAPRSGIPKWVKIGGGVIIAGVLVIVGLVVWYTQFRDVEEELSTVDRDAALVVSTEAPDADPTAETQPSADSTDESPAPTDAPANGVIGDGSWVIDATAANEVGYRIAETIAGVDTEGVGRTDQVTGALTIDGTVLTEASFEVDVASITSDSGSRDGQFRGRIMSTDEFPTATFVQTEPVDLGTEAVEGATAVVDVTGELTLRGVTNPVTFTVDAALQNGRIGIFGNIPVVFEDYGIDNPSFGSVETDDNGLLEFVLVFTPA